MSVIGTPLAGSLAGQQSAERTQSAQRKREEDQRARAKRQADEFVVTKVEAAEAIRSPKGNDQEETHEDRQAHDNYSYDHHGSGLPARPNKIDVAG